MITFYFLVLSSPDYFIFFVQREGCNVVTSINHMIDICKLVIYLINARRDITLTSIPELISSRFNSQFNSELALTSFRSTKTNPELSFNSELANLTLS